MKIKTKIIILGIVLVILMSISSACATQPEDSTSIYENTTAEILNTKNNDFSTLNNDIDMASQSKTLNLTRDYEFDFENDAKYSSGININIDDLVIDGKGHTINANSQARIFNINSNNVILRNLVIINGNCDSHGGSVYWSGLNGKIDNVTFKNSASQNSGGAVYLKNQAMIVNSKFINNTAYFAGAVDFEKNSTINNCEFENNFATYLGGALFSAEHAVISNSMFYQNEAGDGGAIYFFMTGLVENTTFQKNIAIGYGGAITNENTLLIKNSRFLENNGAFAGAIYLKGDGYIDKSSFNENHASKEGGAISSFCNNTSILNSEFNHNDAQIGKSLFIENNNVKIENSTFNNNISSYESEIYMECRNPTLINLTFNNITKENKGNENNIKPVSLKKTAITAKTKTFKLKTKIKKYTIILKTGKTPLKNKRITLKVKGKTYSSKTGKNGKATFKLKIFKKGKFKAIINFKGDKTYKSSKKAAYIKIKK